MPNNKKQQKNRSVARWNQQMLMIHKVQCYNRSPKLNFKKTKQKQYDTSRAEVRRYTPPEWYTGTSLVGVKSYRHFFLDDCHTGML